MEFSQGQGITGERFWVIITAADAGRYQGKIDNQLIHSAAHGLYLGDIIAFDHRHIYDAQRLSDAAALNRQRQEEMAKPGFKNESVKPREENRTET